jgi:hypothetical protein
VLRRHWPIAAVLLVQLGILGIVPARHIRARLTGVAVTLRTEPFDPYDIMAGYYVTLDYQVEHEAARQMGTVPEYGSVWWIAVRRADPAWEFVSVGRERPDPAPDTVALKAKWRYGDFAIVGAGRLYVPEAKRKDANRGRTAALVDMKVGPDGTIALLRMRVGNEVYGE